MGEYEFNAQIEMFRARLQTGFEGFPIAGEFWRTVVLLGDDWRVLHVKLAAETAVALAVMEDELHHDHLGKRR